METAIELLSVDCVMHPQRGAKVIWPSDGIQSVLTDSEHSIEVIVPLVIS